MNKRPSRYKQMEQIMTYVLIGGAILFLLYLISCFAGIIWLKAITAVITVLLSLGSLIFLYLCRELTRRRSQWMSVSALALLLCTLVSLVLHYPRPPL